MTTDAVELVEYVCPQCGSAVKLDSRFVRWCPGCGHGADPKPPQYTGRQARRREREIQESLALFEVLKTAPTLRPSSNLGRAVVALSVVVHLIGLLCLVVPLAWLLGGGPAFPAWTAATVIGAATFLAVRPRVLIKRVKPEFGFGREQAPRLYALLDRCAAELGCRAPDRVVVDADFNAATWRAGSAQRRVLCIGAPLWAVLSGPERLAVLGHELAHQVNGDMTRGLLATSAWHSLAEWTTLLYPGDLNAYEREANRRLVSARRGTGSMSVRLAALLTPIVIVLCFLPFFAVAVGCRKVLTRLVLRCGQRAEYLADELGARLAGTEAALSANCRLTFGASLPIFVRAWRAGRAKKDPSTLWSDFRDYLESIPETEFQRRLLVDRLHNTRTDRSHPAGHLRIALLRERPAQPAAITVTEQEWAAIDAELAPQMLAAARNALRG